MLEKHISKSAGTLGFGAEVWCVYQANWSKLTGHTIQDELKKGIRRIKSMPKGMAACAYNSSTGISRELSDLWPASFTEKEASTSVRDPS